MSVIVRKIDTQRYNLEKMEEGRVVVAAKSSTPSHIKQPEQAANLPG